MGEHRNQLKNRMTRFENLQNDSPVNKLFPNGSECMNPNSVMMATGAVTCGVRWVNSNAENEDQS